MLRSEMNACNEWVGAALYLLNSLMPAFGTRAMPVCSGIRWGLGRVGGPGGERKQSFAAVQHGESCLVGTVMFTVILQHNV